MSITDCYKFRCKKLRPLHGGLSSSEQNMDSWVFLPRRRHRHGGNGEELCGIPKWLWHSFDRPVKAEFILRADWHCKCCEGEQLPMSAQWRPTMHDNPAGGIFIVETFCSSCGDGGRHWAGVSARYYFAASGRCWVDQFGTSCGTRHVYASSSRGVERVGEHAILGRRRRCRHQCRPRAGTRGPDNGPRFWGYADADKYERHKREGGKVFKQREALIEFYENLWGTHSYIEGGYISQQVYDWF